MFWHNALIDIKSGKGKAMHIEMDRIRIMTSLAILAVLMHVAAYAADSTEDSGDPHVAPSYGAL